MDNTVYRREAESGSRERFFRRKKRLEQMRVHFRAHAHTRVRNHEQDVRPRSHFRIRRTILFGQMHVRCGDPQGAAARHGVARIQRNIQEHLVHLASVCPDKPQRRLQFHSELDILADDAPQHRLVLGNERIQIQQSRVQPLLAAERK